MTIYAKLLRLPFFQGIDRDELEAMASKIRSTSRSMTRERG